MNLDRLRQQIRGVVEHRSQGFLGRAGTVFAGTALGQGVAFLMLPLIARVYQAEALGRAATVLAVVSMSALVVCFQYDQALIVGNDAELPYLLLLASGIATTWVVLLAAAILVCQQVMLPRGRHLLASWGIDWTFPVLMLVYAIFSLLINLGLRRDQLSKVCLARMIYYGGASVLQVACGLEFGGKERAFLLAQAAAALVAMVWLFPFREAVNWVTGKQGTRQIVVEIRHVARAHAKFPQYQMGAGLLNAVSIYMPIVFLRVAFSDAWAGWYFMAWRLLAAPMTLVAQAIGQVFYRDSAARERSGVHQGQLVENVVCGLFRAVLLPCVVLGISAPFLVHYFLGSTWGPVATIIRLLLISTIAGFFTSPVSMLLNVKGLQAGALAYNLLLFLGRVLALGIGWLIQSAFGSIGLYSVATLVVMLMFCRYIVESAGGSCLRIARRAKSLVVEVGVVISLALLFWSTHVLYQPFGILVVGFAVCLAGWRDLRREGWRTSARGKSA